MIVALKTMKVQQAIALGGEGWGLGNCSHFASQMNVDSHLLYVKSHDVKLS